VRLLDRQRQRWSWWPASGGDGGHPRTVAIGALGPESAFRFTLQMMAVEVTKFSKRFGIVKMDAKAYVGADLVCDAELTLAMGS
jgi:hypothetical protein